jgi:hypothetical protein
MALFDYEIMYEDSSFVLRRELPEIYGTTTTANITITDTGGDDMLAETAATIPTATTLSSASSAGAKTITVAAGTWEPDDLIRIADSDAGHPETRRVESFNSSTKIITLTERLQYAHSSAAAVNGRWITYTLDASTTATWSLGIEGSIYWSGFSTDDAPLKNTFRVGKFQFAPDDLSGRFAMRYPHYYNALPEHSFDEFYEDALDDIVERFGKFGPDFMKLVSIREGRRLLMAQIAYLIAVGQGDGWEYERDTSLNDIDRLFTQLRTSRNWYDEDEDDIRDDEEFYTANKPLPSRLLN